MSSDAPPRAIRQGVTQATDADAAILAMRRQLDQDRLSLAMLFVDPALGCDAVAAALQRHWPGAPVIGCTGWGHVSSLGLGPATISGASLAEPDFVAVSDRLVGMLDFRPDACWTVLKHLVARLERRSAGCTEANTFAMLLMGGNPMHEERVVNTIYAALGGFNLFGGTANRTNPADGWVIDQGRVSRDSAVVALIRTERPFTLFSSHNFRGTGRRLVITGARPSERLVTEINGEPAADEYARLLGVSVEDLRLRLYIERPIAVKIGDQYYLRSIERVNADGTLLFACALEIGMTLHVTEPDSMAAHLEAEFERIRGLVGRPALMIASDCAHRRLALTSHNEAETVSRLLIEHNAVGFGSYGEQFNRTHLNHTLTGVAIGAAPAPSSGRDG
jgi:hypothetical protein